MINVGPKSVDETDESVRFYTRTHLKLNYSTFYSLLLISFEKKYILLFTY